MQVARFQGVVFVAVTTRIEGAVRGQPGEPCRGWRSGLSSLPSAVGHALLLANGSRAGLVAPRAMPL